MIVESDRRYTVIDLSLIHISSPQMGNNALTALLLLLSRIPFSSEELRTRFFGLTGLFPHGDWRGAALGVDHEDALSGCLTLRLNLFSFDGKTLSGSFDCRAPVSYTHLYD